MTVFEWTWIIVAFFLPLTSSEQGVTYSLSCSSNPCGVGKCYMLSYAVSSRYFCDCPAGYLSAKISGYKTCVSLHDYFARYSGGLIPFSNPPNGSSLANKYFRHISVGYISSPSQPPAWNYSVQWNWVDIGAVTPVKDQFGCRACSSFSTVEAMESLFYIADPSVGAPPTISIQQFLDCRADSCSGGWPTSTLQYAGENDITTADVDPYTASENGENCTDELLNLGLYSISMYEQVSHFGWFGLVLAVQQQPVMVAVDSSSQVFHSYTGGIFDDPNCYADGVDHTVVVVGYDLTADTPFWVLRNSWGVQWGEKGYMRMAITSGDGICGINVIPGFYPVITRQSNWDPCFRGSYGSVNGTMQGRQNPCGSGICTSYLLTYSCTCAPPFVAVQNVDGTQTCAPASPCSFYDKNPCGVGTCRDSIHATGNYTCLCPLGYEMAQMAVTGNPTCSPQTPTSGQQLYIVPDSYNISCGDVCTVYGMTQSLFTQLNPNVPCAPGGMIAAGTVLNVSNNLGDCEVTYSVNSGDTCESITEQFSSQLETNISGPGSPNPDLDCNGLDPGKLICLQRGDNSTDSSVCSVTYTLHPNDTCGSIIDDHFEGDAFDFYKANPGFYCDRLSAVVGNLNFTTTQVCLTTVPFGTILASCSTGQTYTVKNGDTCFKVIGTVYKAYKLFRKLNRVSRCYDSMLVVGRKLCAP